MALPLIPIAIGAALIGGAAWLFSDDAKDAKDANKPAPARRSQKTVLERNLDRLTFELYKADAPRVAILGGPGIGKSTLLYKLSDGKVTPEPRISVKTDATDWSTDPEIDLISHIPLDEAEHPLLVVDFPGFGTVNHPTEVYAEQVPIASFNEILFLVGKKVREHDIEIARAIHRRIAGLRQQGLAPPRLCFVRTMSDELSREEDRLLVAEDIRELLGADGHRIFFTSARTGEGIKELELRLGLL